MLIKKVVNKKINLLLTNFKKNYPLLYNYSYKLYIKFDKFLREQEKEIKARRKAHFERLQKQTPEFIKEFKIAFVMGFFFYIAYFSFSGHCDIYLIDGFDYPSIHIFPQPKQLVRLITWEVPSLPMLNELPWFRCEIAPSHRNLIYVTPPGPKDIYYDFLGIGLGFYP